MAFRVPTFNSICNVYGYDQGVPPIPPEVEPRQPQQECQLTWGRRVQVSSGAGPAAEGSLTLTMSLLLPRGNDIRGPQDVRGRDVVEVPAGTGRWYYVVAVDDVGKGFDNEYRCALLFAAKGTWTPPYL